MSTPRTRDAASSARKKLIDTAEAFTASLRTLIEERGPLIPGSFSVHGQRCGNPSCKCTRGELHSTAVLLVPTKGKKRCLYVRPPDRPDVKRRTEAYRRFKRHMALLTKLHLEARRLANALLEALSEPYQPS